MERHRFMTGGMLPTINLVTGHNIMNDAGCWYYDAAAITLTSRCSSREDAASGGESDKW